MLRGFPNCPGTFLQILSRGTAQIQGIHSCTPGNEDFELNSITKIFGTWKLAKFSRRSIRFVPIYTDSLGSRHNKGGGSASCKVRASKAEGFTRGFFTRRATRKHAQLETVSKPVFAQKNVPMLPEARARVVFRKKYICFMYF